MAFEPVTDYTTEREESIQFRLTGSIAKRVAEAADKCKISRANFATQAIEFALSEIKLPEG